ncbi:hypothetical protein PGB90_008036 [Kerria lacca]
MSSTPLTFLNLPKPKFHTFNVSENKIRNSKLHGLDLSKLRNIPSKNKSSEEIKKIIPHSKGHSGVLSLLPNPTQESTVSPFQISKNFNSNSGKKFIPINCNEDNNFSNNEESNFKNAGKLTPVNCNEDSNFSNNEESRSSSPKKLVPTDCNEDDNFSDNEEYQFELDEDAIQKLCGRKRKGQIGDDIQLIDIQEDKILAESKEALAKYLTDEETYRPSRKKFGGPSSLEKRKHQITYLAYQAKERELELKNQWANNRFSKKQTQSKYGF